jgi:hypothetical protein
MSASSKSDVQRAIKAVMQIAEDLAAGKVSPAEVMGPAVDQCRALFAAVAGPGDALWELQCDVARRVIGMGGIPTHELEEWVAVLGRHDAEHAGGQDDSAEAGSGVSVEPSGQSDGVVVDDSDTTADDEPAVESEFDSRSDLDPTPADEGSELVRTPQYPIDHNPVTGRQVAARGFGVPHDPMSDPPPSYFLR